MPPGRHPLPLGPPSLPEVLPLPGNEKPDTSLNSEEWGPSASAANITLASGPSLEHLVTGTVEFRPFLVFCVLLCLVGITGSAHLKQGAPWKLSPTLAALCQLPPVRGPHRGLFHRYFHNDTSDECEHFTYGGCQGNANNFETVEICVRICKPPETR